MPRTSITIIMTDELKEAIKEAAYRDRLPFSLWCRAVLAREVERGYIGQGEEQGGDK